MSNLTNEQKAIYAILADNVYWDVRRGYETNDAGQKDFTNSNWTPVPEGWSALTNFDHYGSTQYSENNKLFNGFSARVYQKEGTNEIVISYSRKESKQAA